MAGKKVSLSQEDRRRVIGYVTSGKNPPLEAIILDYAARWNCTPSEVLEEYDTHLSNPDIIRLADRWGVKPSKVAEEDAKWLLWLSEIDRVKIGMQNRERRLRNK